MRIDSAQTVGDWLDQQGYVDDAEGSYPVGWPEFPAEQDPELHAAATKYLEIRAAFTPAAERLRHLMEDRGWEAM